MRALLNVLAVGSVFAIGSVLVGGIDDFYDVLGISTLSGGMVILAALAVLGGSIAAQFARIETPATTDPGMAPTTDSSTTAQRQLRPAIVGLSVVLFVVGGFILFRGTTETLLLELGVGDCFDDPSEVPLSGEIAGVTTLPCEDPHDNEVYAITPLAGSSAVYPGISAANEEAAIACLERFESFVGASYQESVLDIFYLTPTSESWAEGDKSAKCAVYRLDGQPLVGTAEGSGL